MKCILRVIDQTNVKFEGLDPGTRKDLVKKLSFMNPKARHTPAFKLGRWDGKVAFARIGGGTFFNLLDIALPLVLEAGYEVDIVDERQTWEFDFPVIDNTYFSDCVWPKGHQIAGQPITLNDHQVEAINRYLVPNDMGNWHSLQEISTGAGKTVVCAALSRIIEPYGRTLVIVPGKDLITQTLEDYSNIGLDTGIYFSDCKQTDNKHIISTWQSLTRMAKEEHENFIKITQGVVCLIIDEAHTLVGKMLQEMMTDQLAHIPIRFAMTGTVPKAPHEFNALLVSVGPQVGSVRADHLQELGILSNCKIDIMQTVDDITYSAWDDEITYLLTDKLRVQFLAHEIKKIATTGNTLVLVPRVAIGKALAEILDCPFMFGEVAAKKRKAEYKSINTEDNQIIVASFAVASTGINIPRLFNMVMIETGRSPIRTVQSVGRGLRIAGDKDFVNIYDVCSTAKFSKKHLTERKKMYKEAGYPATVRKITYR